MRKRLFKVAGAVAVLPIVLLVGGRANAVTGSLKSEGPNMTPAPLHGCPYGDVCVYPENTGWNGDQPKYFFYTYGAHNIYNEYGIHRILDNQYGAHSVVACAGTNGSGPQEGPAEGGTTYGPYSWDQDLTPVNSFVLGDKWGINCGGGGG